MFIDDLATFMEEIAQDSCKYCQRFKENNCNWDYNIETCIQGRMDWLESEVEE